MNLFSKTKISIFSALITFLFIFGGYNIYAANFRDTNQNYLAIFDQYHGEMNALFNSKISHAKTILEDDNFLKDPVKRKDFLVPDSIDQEKDSVEEIVVKCREDERNNVSPLCVSMESLALYMEYVRVLDSKRGDVEDSNANTLQAKLFEVGSQDQALAEEVGDAKRVLENTMTVYNEFLHAYPMHIKYQQIIKQLLQYKLALKDIRRQAQEFPVKFIDATSAQCK